MSLWLLCAIALALIAVFAFILSLVKVLRSQKELREAVRDEEMAQKYIKMLTEEQEIANQRLQDTFADLLKRRQPKPPPPQMQETDPSATIQDRLKRAGELTVKQSKIDTRKGHEYVMQHNELELEKLVVLKTILADGFDPVITIRYNTGDQEMPLSAYVESINKVLA